MLLLQKWRKLFFSCSMPRRGLYRSSPHLKPIHVSLDKDSHQVLKPKKKKKKEKKRKKWHWGHRYCLLPHQTSSIPLLPSRFFTSDDNLQYTLYSTLCSARFHCKFLRIVTQSRYNAVPYYVHDITWKSVMYWNCDRLDRGHSRYSPMCLSCGDIVHLCMICEVRITRTSFLLEEVMASPNRRDSCLYDQYFQSQRWARFSLLLIGDVVS